MKAMGRCAVAVVCLALTAGSDQSAWSQEQAEVRAKTGKRTRVSRKRRIIYNDDGVAEKPSHNPKATAEGFLEAYFNSAVGTQVDTWFYNAGNCWLNDDGSLYDWGKKRQTAGRFGDANQIILEAARKAGMEIFCSLRMNDIHAGYLGIEEPFKLKHPELIIGSEHWPNQYPHLRNGESPSAKGGYPKNSILELYWAGYDFAKPEVIQHRLDYIRKFCTKYDWDGVELDFVRHSLYFKLGEEEENLDTMTEFLRQVRATLDEIGKERGRPYQLAVRVAPTPEVALRTGFDVQQWLEEDLIDLLIAGSEWSWYYSSELKKFVDMGHRYDVPVYLNCPLPEDPEAEYKLSKELREPVIRAICSNFWALGADGVYLFNYPYPQYVDQEKLSGYWLQEIGDPNTLVGLDKLYLPDKPGGIESWGTTGAYFGGPDPFPMHLIYGQTANILVGDDIQKAARDGSLKELRLQVGVTNMHDVEGINIKVNRKKLPVGDIKRVAEDSFETVLQTPPLRQGINEIQFLPGPGSIGRLASTVTGLKLWVRYKHD